MLDDEGVEITEAEDDADLDMDLDAADSDDLGEEL